MNQNERLALLSDARWMVRVARQERVDGFRDRAAEALTTAAKLRRMAVQA